MFVFVGEKTVTQAVAHLEATEHAAVLSQSSPTKSESVSLIVVTFLPKAPAVGSFPREFFGLPLPISSFPFCLRRFGGVLAVLVSSSVARAFRVSVG